MDDSYPKTIDLSKPRYPQSTYLGRLKHFSDLTNPLNLLATRTQLEAAKGLIAEKEAESKVAGLPGIQVSVSTPAEEERLWNAKTTISSTLHPDTLQPIILPFRMSCFVPTNMAVVAGMLKYGTTSAKGIVAWQWINQSVNVGFNYFNANKSAPMNWSETGLAYTAAVVTSVSSALGLTYSIPRLSVSASAKRLLTRLVPFAAVSLAGTANVVLMRGKELQVGIDVRSSSGETLGKSREAAKRAITQTAISRVLIPFPCLTLPPLIMPLFPATWPAGILMAAELGVIGASLGVAMPPAIALFPQEAGIKVKELEDGCEAKVGAKAKGLGPEDEVVFNRGL